MVTKVLFVDLKLDILLKIFKIENKLSVIKCAKILYLIKYS